MNTDGVVGTKTKSNSIMEMREVLGIEAARSVVFPSTAHGGPLQSSDVLTKKANTSIEDQL